MSDYKQLIEQLNLEDIELPDNLFEVKHFSMNAADLESDIEHKTYKKHKGPDNRGKYERSEVYRSNKAIFMRELWQDPEFREKMKNCHTGRPRKLRGPYIQSEPREYKWSEESRKALSERQRGSRWFNNGVSQKRLLKGQEPPEGWVRGKLKNTDKSKQKLSETMKRLWKVYKETENGN